MEGYRTNPPNRKHSLRLRVKSAARSMDNSSNGSSYSEPAVLYTCPATSGTGLKKIRSTPEKHGANPRTNQSIHMDYFGLKRHAAILLFPNHA